MTTGTLFNQLKAGKITKEKFLYEVRRDSNLPFISPLTTFKEAIQILQNRGIIAEIFDMEEGAGTCSCGGSYETHEDAGEKVCASCGDRQPLGEGSPEDEEFDSMEHDHDMEMAANDAIMGQYDMEYDEDEMFNPKYMPETEAPSLRQQVQEFVKKACEGGSSMDEAKEQAREYFSKAPGALNEAVKLGPDQVNPYELKKGIEIEMGYADKAAPSWAEASLMNIAGDYAKAQAKALKNLAKDPAYYTNKIANKKLDKKVTVKGDGYIMAPKSLKEKSNVKTSLSKTEKAKGNPKGVKLMKENEGGFSLSKDQQKQMTSGRPSKEDWNAMSVEQRIEKLQNSAAAKYPNVDKVAHMDFDKLQQYNPKILQALSFPKSPLLAKDDAPAKEFPIKGDHSGLGAQDTVGKIREYVKDQLRKEAQLVKSKSTGATIDIVPDAQAATMQADLQKKGVQTTKTKV